MDARFPERWLNDRRLLHATDSQFRLFTNANAWAVSNRTDGHIPSAELSLITRANTADAAGLVSLGLWLEVPDGWLIKGFLEVQTSKSQLDGLDQRRAKEAERQRSYRERKRSSSRDKSRDGVRDLAHNDKGQDRTGSLTESSTGTESLETAEVVHEAEGHTKEYCPDCTNQLQSDGTCWICGRRKKPLSW